MAAVLRPNAKVLIVAHKKVKPFGVGRKNGSHKPTDSVCSGTTLITISASLTPTVATLTPTYATITPTDTTLTTTGDNLMGSALFRMKFTCKGRIIAVLRNPYLSSNKYAHDTYTKNN
jgi:hypothetical protein